MRNRLVMPILIWAFFLSLAVLAVPDPAVGQQQPAAGTATSEFDPRDLSGFWLGRHPRGNDHPPLTPAGIEMMRGRVPDSVASNTTESNDPMYKCNPQGFPRLVWEENEPIEFVHTENRILQFFQWDRTLRELWLDGRELPSGENLESLGPAWYGHSVAEWDGDTLFVVTTGLDERTWLDVYGNPLSFDARLEERYTRIDVDTIEGRLIIYDPKNYTAPWAPQPTIFTRMRSEDVNFFGWKGLFSGLTEAICAPMNELDDFNIRIRDPGVFGITN